MSSECDIQIPDEPGRSDRTGVHHSQLEGTRLQSRMPKLSHVPLLMTFTLEPPSIIVPTISLPFTIIVIPRMLVSTTTGPSSGLEKNVVVRAVFSSVTVVRRPAVNRGTNCSKRSNGSTIWHSCNACHVGSSSVCLTASSSYAFWSSISATLRSLAFLIHSVACFRIASWVSHSATFLIHFMTCCTLVTSVMTMFTTDCFSFAFTGHWLL